MFVIQCKAIHAHVLEGGGGGGGGLGLKDPQLKNGWKACVYVCLQSHRTLLLCSAGSICIK